MPEFKTVRQVAASGLISEHFLRQMVAKGECPGFYSGTRYLINVKALAEILDARSREGLRREENNAE